MLLRDLIVRNFWVKLLSLCLAVVLWYMAVGRERAEIGLNIPLELVNFPPRTVIANQVPDGINVRIRGSVALTRQVSDRKLRFSMDLGGAKIGPNSFTIKADALGLPRGLEITRLAPAEITVDLERIVTKKVNLLPVIKGEPAAGYIIEDITLEPREVEVQGPESVLKPLEIIWTEPVDVTNLTKPVTLDTAADLPDQSLSLVKPQSIKAILKVDEKIVTRAFNQVPVEPILPENVVLDFRIRPGKVDLVLRGPLNAMTELVTGKKLSVRVNLAGLEPGEHERLLIVAFPPSMEVVRLEPKVVKIRVFEEMLKITND